MAHYWRDESGRASQQDVSRGRKPAPSDNPRYARKQKRDNFICQYFQLHISQSTEENGSQNVKCQFINQAKKM